MSTAPIAQGPVDVNVSQHGNKMTDKELLEAAAAAVGYKTEWRRLLGHDLLRADIGEGYEPWNPLTDDGDAMRLAVRMGFQVTNRFGYSEVVVPAASGKSGYVEADKGDCYAATRRAIVRAAAAVPANDRVEGRDAASSRRVPSHDGLCPGATTENE